jgi:hypothetical protein
MGLFTARKILNPSFIQLGIDIEGFLNFLNSYELTFHRIQHFVKVGLTEIALKGKYFPKLICCDLYVDYCYK